MRPPNQELFEEYCWHLNERHRIYLKRAAGEPPPWTDDPILQNWFFTNVQRRLDKTSIHFKKIYETYRDAPPEQIMLNCGIYRYFCSRDFADAIGWQEKWEPEKLISIAEDRKARGLKNFGGAYVVTNNGDPRPKHIVVVKLFLDEYAKHIPQILKIIDKTNRWRDVVEYMNKNIRGFQDFTSKETILDVMETPVFPEPEDKYSWSPVGPGAKIGINYLWGSGSVDYNETRNSKGNFLPYLEWIYENMMDYLEPHTRELDWTLHDTQWSLCEIGKRFNIKSGKRAKRRYNGVAAPKVAGGLF